MAAEFLADSIASYLDLKTFVIFQDIQGYVSPVNVIIV